MNFYNFLRFQEPFQSEMSKGKKGVILFSFGSIIRSNDLPDNFRRNIFEAFSHFTDYHFIVRDEGEDNVKYGNKWIF